MKRRSSWPVLLLVSTAPVPSWQRLAFAAVLVVVSLPGVFGLRSALRHQELTCRNVERGRLACESTETYFLGAPSTVSLPLVTGVSNERQLEGRRRRGRRRDPGVVRLDHDKDTTTLSGAHSTGRLPSEIAYEMSMHLLLEREIEVTYEVHDWELLWAAVWLVWASVPLLVLPFALVGHSWIVGGTRPRAEVWFGFLPWARMLLARGARPELEMLRRRDARNEWVSLQLVRGEERLEFFRGPTEEACEQVAIRVRAALDEIC